MIPRLAQLAAVYENCHVESSPMYSKTSYMPLWSSPENLGIYHGAGGGKPFADGMRGFDRFIETEAGGSWPAVVQKYSHMFESKFDAFWQRADPKNGASVTVSHGDLRGARPSASMLLPP
eukprot:COSAG01_NODE_3063_length_6650_cov_21.575943_4_plen_120_part_00